MTKITIFKKNNSIFAFEVKGHSGYAEEGADIVCSAVSTATQMTLAGLKEILHLDVKSTMHDGFLRVELMPQEATNPEAQTLLETMEIALADIAKNYARFVKMEVKEDVD